MREIKFKAWNEANQHYDYGRDIMTRYDDEFLEQFTGFYYKNGKEIWEGDIVKYRTMNCLISFSERLGSWRIDGKSKKEFVSTTFHHQIAEQVEKIGTFNENPELLK